MSEAVNEARFGIQRIYVKDISFESPRSPAIFGESWKPKVHLDLNSRTQQVADSRYEVVLTLSLTASSGQDETAYIVEVQQAGLFEVSGLDTERLEQVLSVTCPTVLFPYARETMDTLVIKGGFAPLMLAPVNFEALFLQARQQRASQAAAGAPATDAGGEAERGADGEGGVRH